MKYTITHTTKYGYTDPVPVCHNIAYLKPRNLPHQKCSHFRMVVHPEPNHLKQRVDVYGNEFSYFSIEQAHLGLNITATSKIHVQPPSTVRKDTPWDVMVQRLRKAESKTDFAAYEFAFPTKRTRPFPQLRDYALESFAKNQGLIESTTDLTNRIHTDFEFDPRATTISTPIKQVFQFKRGVCQDFAHLQIACLQSLGLAARYVSGYLRTNPPEGQGRLIGADASHAWLSVFCGKAGWIDFDPTNDVIPSTDHITLAWGRDYSDVPPVRGVVLGGGEHAMTVSVDVEPADDID